MASSAHLRHVRTVLAVALAYVLGLQAFLLAAAQSHETVGFKTALCTQSGGGGSPNHGQTKHDHTCCTSARCGALAPVLEAPGVASLAPRVAIFIKLEPPLAHVGRDRIEIHAQSARGPPLTV